jgi:hypothetical protein
MERQKKETHNISKLLIRNFRALERERQNKEAHSIRSKLLIIKTSGPFPGR